MTSDDRTATIRWTCTLCAADIDNHAGIVCIDAVALALVEAHPSLAPARWYAKHHHCDPSESEAYGIDVATLRTRADLAWWTDHLAGKAWTQQTTWADLAEDKSRGAV